MSRRLDFEETKRMVAQLLANPPQEPKRKMKGPSPLLPSPQKRQMRDLEEELRICRRELKRVSKNHIECKKTNIELRGEVSKLRKQLREATNISKLHLDW